MDVVIKFSTPSQGGRAHLPDLSNGLYRPHVVVDGRPKDEYLGVQFVGCVVEPEYDREIEATLRLPYRGVDYSPLKEGASFVIKEGARAVGSGRVERL